MRAASLCAGMMTDREIGSVTAREDTGHPFFILQSAEVNLLV
jgi:hypothetical protein